MAVILRGDDPPYPPSVIELTSADLASTGGAVAPRRRRARAAAARVGGGIGILIPIVAISSFITYSLGALSNSDPAATILGQDAATPAAVAHLNHVLGLDKPLIVQYWDWLSRAIRGNLGSSYFTQIPVSQSIAQRLPVDLSIAIAAVILAVVIGGTAGTVAGIRRGGWFDRGLTIICSAVSTLPAFVVGIILVVIFAVTVHLLPANGYTGPAQGIGPWLEHIILPSLALALQLAADVARQLRTSLVAVLDHNYITGARVRGLPYRRILLRHALRNAAGPALVTIGYDFPQMLAGAVAAEAVFSLPGLGQLLLNAAESRDIPVVQGLLLVVSTFVIVVNLVVNTLLAWIYRSSEGVGV
jgi:peptide/nickel transport system permease protein